MSFALIRVLMNGRFGQRRVIPTQDIEGYSPSNHESNLEYRMKVEGIKCSGIIHDVNDDPEVLKKALEEKRFPTPPFKRCKTNLPSPAPSVGKVAKKSMEYSDEKNQPRKKPKITKDQVVKGNGLIDVSKIKKEHVQPKLPAKNLNRQVPADLKENHAEENESFDFLTSPALQVPPQGSGPSSEEDLSTAKVNRVPETAQSPTVRPLAERQPKENVKSIQSANGSCRKIDSEESDRTTDKTADQLQELQKKLGETKKENIKLLKSVNDLKKIILNKQDIIDDLMKCNLELQKKAINNFTQLHDFVRGLKQANPNTSSADGSHLSVGYENTSTLMVHVGCNQWILEREWTYTVSLLDPISFVHELGRRLFGEDLLKSSTVTGRGTNRAGKGNQRKWNQLDPVKIEAIRDALDWYLGSSKFREMPAATKTNHVLSVTAYLKTFISDLKKDKNKKKQVAPAKLSDPKKERKLKGQKKEEDKNNSEPDEDHLQDSRHWERVKASLEDGGGTEVSEDEITDDSTRAESVQKDQDLSQAERNVLDNIEAEGGTEVSEDEIERELREGEERVSKTVKHFEEHKNIESSSLQQNETSGNVSDAGEDSGASSIDNNDTVLLRYHGNASSEAEETPVTSENEGES